VAKYGAKGVNLDMLNTNSNALAFYERIGFRKCSQVLDSGTSGQSGIGDDVLNLVREV